jgi:hypothetical protein
MRYMEPSLPRPSRPAPATIAAAVIMLVLCAAFVVSAYSFFVSAAHARIEDPYGYWEGTSFFRRFMGVMTLGVSVFIATCAIGILKMRTWARDAAMYTFVVFTAMTVLSFLAAPAGDADATFWIAAPALLAVQLAVLFLLNSHSTREAFYAIEEGEMNSRRERRRRAYERDIARRRERRERRLAGSAELLTLPRSDELEREGDGPDGMGA